MKTLICIVPANYEELEKKGVASHILQRDLNGYWDKVITVHPFCKHTRAIELSKKHTVLEYRFGSPQILNLWRVVARENAVMIKAHDPYYTGVIGYLLSVVCRIPYVMMICSSYDLMEKQYGKSPYRFKWLGKAIAQFTMSHARQVFGGSKIACWWAFSNGARNLRLVRTGGIDAVSIVCILITVPRLSRGVARHAAGRADQLK